MMLFKSRIATDVPKTLQARLEIMKAIRTLAEDEDTEGRRRRTEITPMRREFAEIALAVQELRRECNPRLQSHVVKYNPDQPRVPAGNADGGQWSGGASGPSTSSTTPSSANADGFSDNSLRYAQLDTGPLTDASGGGDHPISSRDIPADDLKHPVPFVDSLGRSVTDDHGNMLVRPADLPPEMFVREGLVVRDKFDSALNQGSGMSASVTELMDKLRQFGQGGPWDAQRVRGQFVDDYSDYATIAIGLYVAAAGVPLPIVLSIENGYAGLFSNFDAKETKDDLYKYLPKRNVRNTEIGYELYDSGRISVHQ